MLYTDVYYTAHDRKIKSPTCFLNDYKLNKYNIIYARYVPLMDILTQQYFPTTNDSLIQLQHYMLV